MDINLNQNLDDGDIPQIVKVERDELSRVLIQDDELGIVLRCHLLLERLMADILKRFPENDSKLERMSFSKKIDLAIKLGVPVEFRGPLAVINSVRNKFAHEYAYTLEAQDVQDIMSALPPIKRDKVEKALSEYEVHGSLRETFKLCTIIVHSGLCAFRNMKFPEA